MKSRSLKCVTAITLFAALAIPVRLAAQKQIHYSVIDLGTLGGGFSSAGGINNRGDVEGFSTLHNGAIHAFLWRKGHMINLGTLGGLNSVAGFRPSERGQVGGQSDTSTPDPLGEDFCGFGTHLCLPFVWQKGAITPLPTVGGNKWLRQRVQQPRPGSREYGEYSARPNVRRP